MIAGLGGDLVSQAYVEHHVLTDANRTGLGPFQRGLARWWRQVSRSLGPASGARAIHDVAAVPLLRLLQHELPSAAPDVAGLSASMPGAAAVLLSVPWTAAPASMWRDAIRLGLDAQASWALICNGRSLRIVDCTRTWSRSAVEFDFDRLMASAAGVDTLWLLATLRRSARLMIDRCAATCRLRMPRPCTSAARSATVCSRFCHGLQKRSKHDRVAATPRQRSIKP